MGIVENVFQVDGKEYKDQEKLKMCMRKSIPEQGRCFSMGYVILSGQWQWTRSGLWQSREIQRGKRGSKKRNKTPHSSGKMNRQSSDM